MIGLLLVAPVIFAALLEWGVAPGRHDRRDTLANFAVYAGYLAISLVWTPVLFEIYSLAQDHALFDLGPWWLDPRSPRFYASWLALFVLEDLCFYLFHRTSHKLGILWAAHVTHHSSPRFNLSVALRQSWTPFVSFAFWLPLPLLGFDPLMVLSAQFLSLFYQAFLHTELVPELGPLEWIFNTPAHHRVHHGANDAYRDRNFGGVLILWDRWFGTYQELGAEAPRYGIDRALGANPLQIGVHGWIDLGKSAFGKGEHP